MKTKPGVVILVVAFVGLLITLYAMKKTADRRLKEDTDAILDFSNQLVNVNKTLDDYRQVNLTLTNDLAASRRETLTFSNQFTETSSTLTNTKASLQSAQDQVASLNNRLAGLESQNQVLDRRAAALTSAIAGLNAQIADTQQKLADSETNNTFLERELHHQTVARAELEGKFNNLTTVRLQVKKLKEDLLVARRLQWMREGTDPALQQKGAQRLMQRTAPVIERQPHYDLNVEVSSDGAIRVIPTTTNAPVTTINPAPE